MRAAGWRLYLLLTSMLIACEARAEPYLAVQTGFKCGQCHVNPTGGGERTAFGNVFAQTQLAAQRLGDGELWTGEVNRFLTVGGDLRTQYDYSQVTQRPSVNQFELEQARLYATANIIPQRLYLYADELVAPGGATNMEAYAVYWSAAHDYYLKAGQMYLPFGLRLQDQSAFVQDITAINMGTPDTGVELGWERGHWDAQLDITNGELASGTTTRGKQYSGQLAYVSGAWRAGVALARDSLTVGNRNAAGIFGGLRTGPIAWLAEADLTSDESLRATPLRQAAALLEADWRIRQGQNLKLTAEYVNQDRDAGRLAVQRLSLLYELTPFQFVQLRPGIRYSNGVLGTSPASGRGILAFIELHAFF
ncbi:MAG: hypothetical protein JOZ12_03035 [Sinobacteraceae bacterium]|nr:hypothetical protein [Nevskiaceae bacterium]